MRVYIRDDEESVYAQGGLSELRDPPVGRILLQVLIN